MDPGGSGGAATVKQEPKSECVTPQPQAGQQGQQTPQQSTTSSALPLPPMQYIQLYTDENIAKGTAPQPPKPISEGSYMMFGTQITINDAIIAPLESQNWKRVYPRGDYDHKKELKKINLSILVNFLDLLDVLIRCPDTEKRAEKCHDLATLFINFHHLINELRPHQARETIRVALHHQRKTRHETAHALERQMMQAINMIQNDTKNISEPSDIKPFADLHEILKKVSISEEVSKRLAKNAAFAAAVSDPSNPLSSIIKTTPPSPAKSLSLAIHEHFHGEVKRSMLSGVNNAWESITDGPQEQASASSPSSTAPLTALSNRVHVLDSLMINLLNDSITE